jgi:hypothetical protein
MTIRKASYKNKHGYDVVFKRIRIDVEEVDHLVIPRFGETIDTGKPWVGEIDDKLGKFKLIRSNPTRLPVRYLEGNFFNLLIEGKVTREAESAHLDVRYKLDWITVAYLGFIAALSLTLCMHLVINNEWKELDQLILVASVGFVVPVILILVQVNDTAKKISEVIGAER